MHSWSYWIRPPMRCRRNGICGQKGRPGQAGMLVVSSRPSSRDPTTPRTAASSPATLTPASARLGYWINSNDLDGVRERGDRRRRPGKRRIRTVPRHRVGAPRPASSPPNGTTGRRATNPAPERCAGSGWCCAASELRRTGGRETFSFAFADLFPMYRKRHRPMRCNHTVLRSKGILRR